MGVAQAIPSVVDQQINRLNLLKFNVVATPNTARRDQVKKNLIHFSEFNQSYPEFW